MITRDEATRSARKAFELLGERMAGNPGYGVYIHAHEQLERMLTELGYRYLPPAQQRLWVDLGLMAVKELEASDPDFANALMDADYDFKHAS
jgi:hypothetical protein